MFRGYEITSVDGWDSVEVSAYDPATVTIRTTEGGRVTDVTISAADALRFARSIRSAAGEYDI